MLISHSVTLLIAQLHFIFHCTTDNGWWFIQNMFWLNHMNFKNIVWFIKVTSLLLLLLLLLWFHDPTTQPKFLTAGKIVVSGNNKLPSNTKMFLFPVLYISNTFLSTLADPSSADLRIKVIDVSTPISFKLPFNRNGTVPKAPNSIGMTLLFTSHILSILWPDFDTFQPSLPTFLLLHWLLELPRLLHDSFSCFCQQALNLVS